jgi:hypothetical protein
MRINPRHGIIFSGCLWMLVGVFLLTKGLKYLVISAYGQSDGVIEALVKITGDRKQASLILMAAGLFAGFIKGRWVLVKTVKRVVAKISSLPNPAKISEIYSLGYVFLILGMVVLGISLKWLPIASSVRGFVDMAIGSALINGAMLYFRLYPKDLKQQE